eukprot:CAMPEP_0119334810 /NCGR_PEP_ID=MMETSP1333-20130426/88118_1 /TAXON_ID=418940 /ORGANISM="Scyphosphaera apsteinii, Strain RCC1455" /LENGTH=136 /DNA_ID=CAMNT_0007345197 /DNA_START=42 /DNA_END=452 /DNA_ORIENTATION=+
MKFKLRTAFHIFTAELLKCVPDINEGLTAHDILKLLSAANGSSTHLKLPADPMAWTFEQSLKSLEALEVTLARIFQDDWVSKGHRSVDEAAQEVEMTLLLRSPCSSPAELPHGKFGLRRHTKQPKTAQINEIDLAV